MSKPVIVEFADEVKCKRCALVQPLVTVVDMAWPYKQHGIDVAKFIRDERDLTKRVAIRAHQKVCEIRAQERGPVVLK